jgi:hypothetical protein
MNTGELLEKALLVCLMVVCLMAIAHAASIDFGNVPVNTPLTLPSDITVDTGYTISLAAGSGIDPPFSFGFGNCSNFGGPGTCTIDETFMPPSLGPFSGDLNVDECPNAGGLCLPAMIPVSGSGVSVLNEHPDSLNFGDVPVGTMRTLPSNITVDTGYTISLATGSGINPPFSFGFGNCSNFGGPGACTIDETFMPASQGAFSGVLNVDECPNAGGACLPATIAVSGTTTPEPGTWVFLGSGLLGLVGLFRIRREKGPHHG